MPGLWRSTVWPRWPSGVSEADSLAGRSLTTLPPPLYATRVHRALKKLSPECTKVLKRLTDDDWAKIEQNLKALKGTCEGSAEQFVDWPFEAQSGPGGRGPLTIRFRYKCGGLWGRNIKPICLQRV